MVTDERAQTALERAREILERQPSPEELAQDEERRRSNRLAEIMNMTVTKEAPPMVRKVNGNALRDRPTNRPETEQEITDRMKAHAVDLCCEIMRAVRAENTTSNKIAEAITPIVSEIILVSIANQIKRAELERRIEALEKQMKPRHRVAAITAKGPQHDHANHL